jgi:hypothetical protein
MGYKFQKRRLKVKLNKTILKQIIKEELKVMQEIYPKNEFGNFIYGDELDYYRGARKDQPEEKPPQAQTPKETPLESRVNQIIAKMTPAESLLKSIDDPNEVIELLVAMVMHIKKLNPDLTGSELQRTIDLLRTKTLPAMRKQVK